MSSPGTSAIRPSVYRLALVLVLVVAILAPSLLLASDTAKVKNIRYRSTEGHTRVVLDLSADTPYIQRRLKNPDRLYFDLRNSKLGDNANNDIKLSGGPLKRIRAAQYDKQTVRVVLELGSVKEYKVFTIPNPSRLVVDIYGPGRATVATKPLARPAVRAVPVKPAVKPAPATVINPLVKRIVVDAGHGGKDPGALGLYNQKEKTIVLDIAKRLKRVLEAKGYEVFLTRSTDKYLTLEERTVVANRKNADLFISIHTNAHRRKEVKGVETYLLNWTDNKQAMKVAARENAISLRRMEQARSELGVIFASLALQSKRDESLALAHYVQNNMVDTLERRYNRISDHGVRQAMFYVLFGAKMPSVLVEASYITNPEDAKRLRSERYRQYLAEGIASGIAKYFKSLTSVPKVAMR